MSILDYTNIVFRKPAHLLSSDELFGITALAKFGYHVVVQEENPLAAANSDLLIDGELWELKNITNADSSISNQIKRARIKWFKLGLDEAAHVVFTMNNSVDSSTDIVRGLKRRKREGERILFINLEGEITEI